MKPVYKRILLKLSGEALAGDAKFGLDFEKVLTICESIKKCVDLGVEICIVVGGGNFWRGMKDGGDKMVRVRADHMGMLATAINAAFLPPALPAVTVATGIPGGICTVESSESNPLNGSDATGMPITGNVVCAAMTPAKCAAMPAAQIRTLIPFSLA